MRVMIWKVIKTAIFHNFFNIAVMIARIASLNKLYFFALFLNEIIVLYYAFCFKKIFWGSRQFIRIKSKLSIKKKNKERTNARE